MTKAIKVIGILAIILAVITASLFGVYIATEKANAEVYTGITSGFTNLFDLSYMGSTGTAYNYNWSYIVPYTYYDTLNGYTYQTQVNSTSDIFYGNHVAFWGSHEKTTTNFNGANIPIYVWNDSTGTITFSYNFANTIVPNAETGTVYFLQVVLAVEGESTAGVNATMNANLSRIRLTLNDATYVDNWDSDQSTYVRMFDTVNVTARFQATKPFNQIQFPIQMETVTADGTFKAIPVFWQMGTTSRDIFPPYNLNVSQKYMENYGGAYTVEDVDSAYNTGSREGYQNGYSNGLSTAQGGTWTNLFNSVFQAPIETLFGHYDNAQRKRVGGVFNLALPLGSETLDLTGFVTALFSMIIVFGVVGVVLKFFT